MVGLGLSPTRKKSVNNHRMDDTRTANQSARAKDERDECNKCASRDGRCCGIGRLSRLARSTAGE
jgi:hypothetical protein